MKIDLRKLYGLKSLLIDESIKIPQELYTKMNVRSMSEVLVKGSISVNYENNIDLDLNLSGNFIMPCSITFEDVKVPFNCNVQSEILENELNDDFYLDLLDILWENIVLEIPFNVIKEGAEIKCLQGEGWELKRED